MLFCYHLSLEKYLKRLEPPFHWHKTSLMLCANGPVVREKILNFVNVFYLFVIIVSPLEKGPSYSFEKTWIPFTQVCLVPNLLEISQVVLEKIFKYVNIIIISNSNVWPLIWTNRNPFNLKMLCAKFGWKWPRVSGL